MPSIVERLGKWKLHRFYARNPIISKFLPQTAVLTESSLSSFLDKYRVVYIKSTTIHTGRGIVKAWKAKEGYRFVRVRGKERRVDTVKQLIAAVKEIAPNGEFIVQKAIDLARIDGRTYDIRVMMMRDGKRKWQYAGMVAKVSGAGSIVSNVRRGKGYVTTVEQALAGSGFDPAKIRNITHELKTLGQQIILYSEKYPFYSYQSGIDLAVDNTGRIWIIEVNLHNPSHGLFKELPDKSQYRRVRSLFRDYFQHNKRVL